MRSVLIGSLSFLFAWLLIYLAVPIDLGNIRTDYSQTILARDSSFLRVFLNEEEQWCLPPSLQADIPVKLESAVLQYEDQYFYKHPGVDPFALFRATYLNLKHRRVVSGGSTITMQLARMIGGRPRTMFNKFREIFLALKLELYFSKQEILKKYLNHAPYGSNVRGYSAATYRFFGKKPEQLTWAEAATLAVLPNAPGMVFPTKNHHQLKRKRDDLLLQLQENGVIDQETYELSLLEATPSEIVPFPLAAPHLTDRIHLNNQIDVVYTTIDPDIQYETNFFVQRHAGTLLQKGVENACALVVDNETGEVVSYVGSQNYNDLQRKGRVDGIRSARSSGSILKPYLYALAIDDGLILPQSLIRDVPSYFNSFSPKNASEKFSGIVPANKALIHSLNVPAVRLLNAYGVQKFYNKLEAAGVGTLFRTADDYGLPLILGGAEVSPWDMARLYRGLSRGGVFSEISFTKDNIKGYEPQLVSHGASYLILDELKELIRPGLEFYWKKYSSQRPIAWKTGTSYGHKDAWAVGCTPKWTIVVWVGNFDGSSNRSLSGMSSAGPLMFDILNVLPSEKDQEWFTKKISEFVFVNVCEQSGFYASDNCQDAIKVRAPKRMRPVKTCPYHVKIHVEDEMAVCSHCWDQDVTEQSFLKFPPDVYYYLRKSGNIVEQEPRHNPVCKTRQEKDILQIIYPLNNANVFIPKDFDGSHQPLVSRLATQFPDREVFWYLDDEYLGSTISKPTLPLTLNAGEHLLTVIDSEGNRDQVNFSVILN